MTSPTLLDPPVRADGLCAVCEQPRETHRSRLYGRTEAQRDPFCSVECARAFHGTSLPTTEQRRAQQARREALPPMQALDNRSKRADT